MFVDKEGKTLEHGDYFMFIEKSGNNVVIGKIWKATDGRTDVSRLWYYVMWGTNVLKTTEYPLTNLCNDHHNDRVIKLDGVAFAEEILGIKLTDAQKVMIEISEGD